MKDTSFFPALTGFRAIAALMVYFSHFNPFISEENPNNFLSRFTFEMQCGVGLFFVLSGFLITYKYYDLAGNLNFKVFSLYMRNRMARIYPVFFLLTTATFLYHGFDVDHNYKIYILNITFLKGFSHCFMFSGIMPGWSLTVEEVFYFVAPFIFIFLHGQARLQRVLRLFLIVLACLFMSVFIWNVHDRIHEQSCWLLGKNQTVLYTFFGRSFDFVCGIGLALWWREKGEKRPGKIPWKTIGGLVLIITSIFLVALLRDNLDWSTGIRSTPGMLLNNFFLPLGTTLLIAGLISETSLISSVLGSRFMSALGKSSYVFYLVHVGFIHVILYSWVSSEWFCLPALLLLSYVIYRWIEHPLHRKWRVQLG